MEPFLASRASFSLKGFLTLYFAARTSVYMAETTMPPSKTDLGDSPRIQTVNYTFADSGWRNATIGESWWLDVALCKLAAWARFGHELTPQ